MTEMLLFLKKIYLNKWAGRVVGLFVFVFLAISFLQLPTRTATGIGLDQSWILFLNYAHETGLQAGKDYVFTYGPLGYLTTSNYTGWSIDQRLVFEILIKSWAALSFVLFWKYLTNTWRVCLLCLMVISPVWFNHAFNSIIPVTLLFWAFIFHHSDTNRKRLIYYASSVFISIIVLCKFTLFISGGFLLFSYTLYFVLNKHYAVALKGCSLFIVGSISLWMLLGQNLLNIPRFLMNSWAISSGYGKTMMLYESTASLQLGLAIVLICFFSSWFVFREVFIKKSEKRITSGIVPVLVGAFLLFITWKIGFVRSAIGHRMLFLGLAPMLILSLVTLVQSRRNSNIILSVSFIIVVSLVQLSFLEYRSDYYRENMRRAVSRIGFNLSALSNVGAYKTRLKNSYVREKERSSNEEYASIIGDSTVDVFGYRISEAIYSDLNLTPRPIFQSYSAYSKRLQEINEDFYNSSNAPQFVLFGMGPIDNRFTPSQDAGAFLEILQDYDFVSENQLHAILERHDRPAVERVLVIEREEQWDVPISLGEYNKDSLIITIEAKPSLLGHLIAFFYKPPKTEIVITTNHGKPMKYTFLPTMWETGVLINPIVRNKRELILLKKGVNNLRVEDITLVPSQDGWLSCFKTKIRIKVETFDHVNSSGYLKNVD